MESNTSVMSFNNVNPPHIHRGFTKDDLMMKTFYMMLIIAVASVIIMGIDAFIHIFIAISTVLWVYAFFEVYQNKFNIDRTYDSPASPLVAGMIVGLSMPIASPFYLTAVVAFLTIFVFKYGQHYLFHRKYLNPAASAKTILLIVLSVLFILDRKWLDIGMIFHRHHIDELNLLTADGFQDAMWIFKREELFGKSLSATAALFFWQTHGWIGGACGVLVLIVGSISAYWLRYKWRIIVGATGTMLLLAIGIGIILQGDILLRISFHVFTGSFIFMVFFMATEPQSTPMPEFSQYIFGIALAIITFILQLANVLGGSIIALVFLNAITPFLDKIGYRKPYGLREQKGGTQNA